MYRITYSEVVVKCQSGEFLQELVPLDLSGERGLVDLGGWSRVIQQSSLGPHLDQFSEGAKVGRPAVLRALSLCTELF